MSSTPRKIGCARCSSTRMPRVASRCEPPWCPRKVPPKTSSRKAHGPTVDHIRKVTDEAVVRCANPDERLARIEVVDDEAQLFARQRDEAVEEHEQIGGCQVLDARDVVPGIADLWTRLLRRIDEAVGVLREQDRAVEAVARGQEPREHRHGFFAAILLVGRDQHDVLATTWTRTAFVGEPARTVGNGMRVAGAGRQNHHHKQERHQGLTRRENALHFGIRFNV